LKWIGRRHHHLVNAMADREFDHDRYRSYLLGELDDGDMSAIEDEVWADAQAYEALLASESELIDAWRAGELSRKQAERCAMRFGASERVRASLGLSAALQTVADRSAAATAAAKNAAPSWWSRLFRPRLGGWLAFACAAALLTLWLASSWNADPSTSGRIALQAIALRSSGDTPAIVRPARGDQTVAFALGLDREETSTRFRVRLLTNDRTSWQSGELERQPNGEVWIDVPREQLRPGSYELALESGPDDEARPVAFYAFEVRESTEVR
jgi:hypothetical protein